VVPSVTIVDVADPASPRLEQVAHLLNTVFVDPDTVLGLDRIRAFLGANAEPAAVGRTFFVLAAVGAGDQVVGASLFSYVPASNCGFSEYILSHPSVRGQGLGRQLFEARKRRLETAAQATGQPGCHGLFIEATNPARTPPELLEAERETEMDAAERLRLFAHLGFRRVDYAYVQPPLGPGQAAVDYLDLLFAPWSAAEADTIPAAWVLETLAPIWRAWSPTQPPPQTLDGHSRLRLLPL